MLEELINKNYDMLNSNDILIWKYISSHRKECEKISIDALAKKCHVSRTTVLRFAKRIGLKGFAELKVYLRMERSYVSGEGMINQTLEKTYVQFVRNLGTYDFGNIVSAIKNADNIFVYGDGAIQKNVALEFKRMFLAVQKLIFTITSTGETEGHDKIINDGDVFFVISVSGENDKLIDFVKRLRLKSVKIIAITSSKENRLIHLADEYICVESIQVVGNLGETVNFMSSYFIALDHILMKYVESCRG